MLTKRDVKTLISIANELDRRGMVKEANQIDGLIKTAGLGSDIWNTLQTLGVNLFGVDPNVLVRLYGQKAVFDLIKGILGKDPEFLKRIPLVGPGIEERYKTIANMPTTGVGPGALMNPDVAANFHALMARRSLGTAPAAIEGYKQDIKDLLAGKPGRYFQGFGGVFGGSPDVPTSRGGHQIYSDVSKLPPFSSVARPTAHSIAD